MLENEAILLTDSTLMFQDLSLDLSFLMEVVGVTLTISEHGTVLSIPSRQCHQSQDQLSQSGGKLWQKFCDLLSMLLMMKVSRGP